MPFDTMIAAMSRPEFYPHSPDSVRVMQTHISHVFLAGDEVYKVKKPVRFTFLDFSRLDRRRFFCHEEVRLNRRLAEDVYRGVVSICKTGDGYRLGDEADPEAVEYAVHMRRLPDECTLDCLLERNEANAEMMDLVAKRLSDFHRRAEAGPAVAANGSPGAIMRILQDNFINVQSFRDQTIAARDDDAIQDFSDDFMMRYGKLFLRRQDEDRIRDCHGDLHSEHLCFAERLIIFDCIEFNTHLRYCDVASEVAFLAMDLDYHRRRDLAEHLVYRYAEYAQDPDVTKLASFYKCYRAYVRGKVDSLKSVESEVDVEERAAAAASARRHFELAYRYTWDNSPSIVVVCGLSGSGKSLLATMLSHRTGFIAVNSDVVRKHLAGLSATAHQAAGYEEGLYDPKHSVRTYQALLEAASSELEAGHGVILDATFMKRSDRDAVRKLAASCQAPVLFVECHCSEEIVRKRLAERARHGKTVSDADGAIYLEQRRRFEPFGADEADHCLRLDTDREIPDLAWAVESALRKRIEV